MRTVISSSIGLGVLSSLLVACSGLTTDKVATTSSGLSVALTPITGGCAEVIQAAKQTAIDAVNRSIASQIRSYMESVNSAPGGYCGMYYGSVDAGAAAPSAGAQGSSSGHDSSGEASQVSGTNNQVAGVDEADFVKNDTKYIYTAVNGALQIVDAFPAAQAHTVSKTPLAGTPLKLFIDGDRAFVYASVPNPTAVSPQYGSYGGPPSYSGGSATGCEYAYEQSCFDGDGTSTQVTVFDIHDRGAPTVVRTIAFSGSLIAARKIGHAVHTVVTSPAPAFGTSYGYQGVQTCDYSTGKPILPSIVLAAYEQQRKDLIAQINLADTSAYVPTITDSRSPGAAASCEGFYRSSQSDGASFTTLHSVDMVNDGPATTATVFSRSGAVYASASALYMGVTHQQEQNGSWYEGYGSSDEVTTVHAFRVGDAPNATRYSGSGITDGHLLNQFAMDEYDGHLRLATTNGYDPDPNVASEITVFQPNAAGGLDVAGQVKDIAKGEDIRSVRFDGPKGYVVTFKKTDPLFVFDLADAHAPTLTGELQIPGFSTYMHLMDATHLLTIGYDANDEGSFAWFNGVRLQIFDVSDMRNPRLVAAEDIGTRGSSSEALENHYAFNYYAPKGVLAIPMTVCEGGGNGMYGDTMTFSGLMVYDVNAQTGFHLRGRIAHPQLATGSYDSASCSNWWTNASSEVKRSVIMDNDVYSISESVIKVDDLDALGAQLAEVSLK